jgi:hypothetical protein
MGYYGWVTSWKEWVALVVSLCWEGRVQADHVMQRASTNDAMGRAGLGGCGHRRVRVDDVIEQYAWVTSREGVCGNVMEGRG